MLSLLFLPSQSGCQFWRRAGVSSSSIIASRQYVQEAVASLDGENTSEALRKLTQAVKANPENYEARSMYADLLWKSGNNETAIIQKQLAVQHEDATAEMFVELAQMYYATGEYPMAQRALKQGLRLNTASAAAWVLQGEIYEKQGKPEEAVAAYHQAVFCEPENMNAAMHLTDGYLAMGKPQRALEMAQFARSRSTSGEGVSRLLYREGLAMTQLQRHADAASVLAKAANSARTMEEKAELPQTLAALASAQYHAGQREDAILTAQRGVDLAPENTQCAALLQQWKAPDGILAEVQPQYGNNAQALVEELPSTKEP